MGKDKIPSDYKPPKMPEHLKDLYSAAEWRQICWADKCMSERIKKSKKDREKKDGGES